MDNTIFRRETKGIRLFLNKSRRKYVVMLNKAPEVFDGYSFSINKKFYGVVIFLENKNLWFSFDIYSGRILSKGNTRREAVLNAVEHLNKIGLSNAFEYAEKFKIIGKRRGLNTRALRIQ